jgi:hypothetical protein
MENTFLCGLPSLSCYVNFQKVRSYSKFDWGNGCRICHREGSLHLSVADYMPDASSMEAPLEPPELDPGFDVGQDLIAYTMSEFDKEILITPEKETFSH